MSKISLAPNASGTGNFTIASPNSSTDRTLTLPDNTGTILTSASNTNFPAGSIIQVVQATYSTSTTTSSSSYSDTGLTASITPSSSSNKILVIVAQNGVIKATGNTKVNIKLFRGATDLTTVNAGATDNTNTNLIGTTSIVYLDSPATTSSTTYKTQFSSANNVAFAGVQDSSATSTITLIEVKA